MAVAVAVAVAVAACMLTMHRNILGDCSRIAMTLLSQGGPTRRLLLLLMVWRLLHHLGLFLTHFPAHDCFAIRCCA